MPVTKMHRRAGAKSVASLGDCGQDRGSPPSAGGTGGGLESAARGLRCSSQHRTARGVAVARRAATNHSEAPAATLCVGAAALTLQRRQIKWSGRGPTVRRDPSGVCRHVVIADDREILLVEDVDLHLERRALIGIGLGSETAQRGTPRRECIRYLGHGTDL